MTLIQFKGENVKTKNIIKVLEGIKLSGLMPTTNYMSYWDNTLDESCPSVEFACRDGSFCNIVLRRRHTGVSICDSQSEDSSMATERERKTVRKRAAPNRLIENNDEETGNVLCHLCLVDVVSGFRILDCGP